MLDSGNKPVGALLMAGYPRDDFGSAAAAIAANSAHRHKEPDDRYPGKRHVAHQSTSGVMQLLTGGATFGAHGRSRRLKLQDEAVRWASGSNDGVAWEKDVVEIAGLQPFVNEGFRRSLSRRGSR